MAMFHCDACGNARNSGAHRNQAALCQKKIARARKAVDKRLKAPVDHHEHVSMVSAELRSMRERAA